MDYITILIDALFFFFVIMAILGTTMRLPSNTKNYTVRYAIWMFLWWFFIIVDNVLPDEPPKWVKIKY